MMIKSISIKPVENGYSPLELGIGRGSVECRYYPCPGATVAVLLLGGTTGGWDSPARDLYPQLAVELPGLGISVLRVRYRQPDNLGESTLDALAGLSYLQKEGISTAGVVGYSFGGAVSIQTAVLAPVVRTVVALATQSFGTEPVADLAPMCSVLLVHGSDDPVLPPYCSQWAYFLAGDPKRLVLFEGAGHDLEEVAVELHSLLKDWLIEQLRSS